ncbi:sigma 54-interacting transcriptional regulator [Chitinophaga sp. sic0106]|uniref:sigma 54-interacting transcriptional regulator n=1 Tax=Chitinophaga sp. sic0106 TaxID=2854785 RepID=UPI001C4763AC|nr:sigma 54-interacting transcriptional regulator [Chitinophaga sp. sic0106]MBV7532889.1 sigma 54-interacting transcriptional regulator [Chitinophaga sp. sic0106]
MSKKVLIVEDLFIEAKNLEIILKNAGYAVCGIARTLAEARALAEREPPELALVDIHLKGGDNGIELAGFFREKDIAFIYISANHDHDTLVKAKATQPYGFIVKPFREQDLMVTLEIAEFRHEHSLESVVRKEAQLHRRLQEIIQSNETWQGKMQHIAAALQPFLPFDYLVVCASKGARAGEMLSYLRIGFDEYQSIGLEEFKVIARLTATDLERIGKEDVYEKEPVFYVNEDFNLLAEKSSLVKIFADVFSLQSLSLLPVQLAGDATFSFAFYSRRPDAYNAEQNVLLDRLRIPLATAMEDMLAAAPQPTVSPKPAPARMTGFDGIVGNSHLLLNIFDQIAQVAPVDTSVLILGESGTGKERIAESVHRLSNRREQPFVKVNCTALPYHLIESELFGHEKGAFTGATDRRIGKFERADGGTIFLDEIGDMPYELQAKLLRVLQEKEIEPIGGKVPVKVSVRVIAATNRNLEKEVAGGRFRLDLYYRLNIFPITLPPLRDRQDDIPLLIRHFISINNKRTNKQIMDISPAALRDALTYSWPGNIRELENLVERAVLLTKDKEIKALAIPAQIPDVSTPAAPASGFFKSIDQNEKDHIIAVLRHCKGKVWGPGGAAELLELPPSTLNSRMKKLGITRDMIL